MAVGPDVLKKKTGEEKAFIDSLEKRIDKQLQRCGAGMKVTVDVNTYESGVRSSIVQAEIKARYLKAGWKSVTFHEDQKEGEWIEFRAPANSRDGDKHLTRPPELT